MDRRTHDRLTTAADLAPWVVAAVSLAAVGLPLLRSTSAVARHTTPPASAQVVAAGPITAPTDPYQPGQSLPEGYGAVDDQTVQVDQRALNGRAARVAVIGDSLTVGATPGLRLLLKDVNLRIDAKVGRNMLEGPKAAGTTKAATADIVLVALGSNDSCDSKECSRRIRAILAAVSPTAPLVWMLPATFRPNMATVRAAVQDVLLTRPRSIVIDWQPYQDDHPEIMQGDHIHLTPAGYRLRAEVLADEVHALLVPSRR